MEVTQEPISVRSDSGAHLYRRSHCWDSNLPMLGVIAGHPWSGGWEMDPDFSRAILLAQRLDYGSVSFAYINPAYLVPGLDDSKHSAGGADMGLVGKSILDVIDDCAAVLCAWGAQAGGAEAMQMIQIERPHTWLFNLGLRDGYPRTIEQATGTERLTRWRV